MSKVPLSISLLGWFFLSISLSTRSPMQKDNTPLGLLWEETIVDKQALLQRIL